MKIRFQADADIDPDIRKGLLRREPSIDFRPASGIIPDGTPDSEVLRIAAEDGGVLVSGDVRTLGVHFPRLHRNASIAGSFADPSISVHRNGDRRAADRLAELDFGRPA